jgi:hypothetical protein
MRKLRRNGFILSICPLRVRDDELASDEAMAVGEGLVVLVGYVPKICSFFCVCVLPTLHGTCMIGYSGLSANGCSRLSFCKLPEQSALHVTIHGHIRQFTLVEVFACF